MVIDSIAYSCVNYALVGLPIIQFQSKLVSQEFWLLWLIAAGILLVLPCILALVFSKLRKMELFQKMHLIQF